MNFGFIIDNRKCIGCHACTVACKSENDVPLGVNRTWVKYIEKGTFPDNRRLFSVMRCNHCAEAPCVEICPTAALYTREDGIVDFDDRRCISCKACTQACPYDALYIHPETKTAEKCNYCTHRTDIGLEPACVVVCPEQAIVSGDMDDPGTKISKLLSREPVSVRKPEKGTQPKLYYIDADRSSLEPGDTSQRDSYMWSSQSRGVGKFAGSSSPKATYEEPPGRMSADSRNASDGSASRVYDAPAKGVLWGWEVSAYVFTKALASGAFLVTSFGALVAYQVPDLARVFGAVSALIMLAVTGLLLIRDLGRPDRFLYVLLRPQWRSWLSRGAYIITAYGAFLSVWLALVYFGLAGYIRFIEPIGILLAMLSAVYTAFLFAQAKGRDFWQTPMLGVNMLLHAFIGGLALLLVANVFFNVNPGIVSLLRFAVVALIAVHLALLFIEINTAHPSADARSVLRDIIRGRFAVAFWAGVVVAGNVVPALVAFFSDRSDMLGVSGLLMLAGLYLVQHIWVRAPQHLPLS